MGGVARIAVICLLTTGWRAAVAGTPLAVFPIDEASIAQMSKLHPLALAEVNDPVYKRKQRYQGLWLRDVLKDLGRGGHAETGVYVRFRCKDGYLPIMPLDRAMGGKGLIAIRDANAPPGENWQPLPGSGTSSTLAPSYLVWLSPPGDPEEYPWPYQMVAIELVSSSDALAGLNPDGSTPGHELFVTHCLKCQSGRFVERRRSERWSSTAGVAAVLCRDQRFVPSEFSLQPDGCSVQRRHFQLV
jgi:hypothetical protein